MESTHIKSLKGLEMFLHQQKYSQLVVLVDSNTAKYCLPLFRELDTPIDFVISIAAGEEIKTLQGSQIIWDSFLDNRLDRQAILINLGGGVITDLGGFCATIYKRGIRFINVPTSLLAMVDAAIGGKTGIDYKVYKNIIGSFSLPIAICTDPIFLTTLPKEEWINGYAEVYKHALIRNTHLIDELHQNEGPIDNLDWTEILYEAIHVKKEIVEIDPLEKGLRKILNFGHTVGHGIESVLMKSTAPIAHGTAVAIGIICESYLSWQREMITKTELIQVENHIVKNFNLPLIKSSLYYEIVAYCENDKKNIDGKILCSLIGPVGTCSVDIMITGEQIIQSLEYYNRLVEV